MGMQANISVNSATVRTMIYVLEMMDDKNATIY
jgi:hypothetical protein